MVALVTSLYGEYDDLQPLPHGHGFEDAVCVTDDPDLAVAGWRTVVQPSDLPPRNAAKTAKTQPWRYTDEPSSVWIDASFRVLGSGLRDEAERHMRRGALVAFVHPSGRSDAYEEAVHSVAYAKYVDIAPKIVLQVQHYMRRGLPLGSGLWEVGVMARNHRVAAVRYHGVLWQAEIDRWTVQDQISFPWACRLTALQPTPWGAQSHQSCGWVKRNNHRDGT